VKTVPRKRRVRKPLFADGAGEGWRSWWAKWDRATHAERRAMLRGPRNIDLR
jgi:hypothetical protein